MRSFTDEAGREWVATAHEEETPRHHGRWYLVFRAADADDEAALAMPEVRWQTRDTAERTIRTMSTDELRRRLGTVRARRGERTGDPWKQPLRAQDASTK